MGTLTVTKILEIFDSVQRDDRMIVINNGNSRVVNNYSASRKAKWECLRILLDCETTQDAFLKVYALAKRHHRLRTAS